GATYGDALARKIVDGDQPITGGIQKLSLTVGHADLTAAATSQVLAIGTLPANSRIVGRSIALATPFTGGSVSACTVDIGSTGDADAVVDGANVLAAAVDGQASAITDGIAPNKHFASETTLNATFISASDNLVNLAAGACTIDILYIELP
ncbi:MAG: hypothetical protein ACPGYP_10755, partial [Solirubrobacterales bacterium]